MIPYFYYPTIQLGPLTIYVWGMVVAVGILVAMVIAARRALQFGLDPRVVWSLGAWVILSAFIGARLFHVVFYNAGYYWAHPIDVLKVWEGGLSSFGGILAASVAALIYFWRHKLPLLKYADVIMYALPFGWAIGRIGCFITHLHIGVRSTLPIAVAFPGGSRLDMGLIESLVMFIWAFIVVVVFARKQCFEGFYLVSTMMFYGVLRFILDFGRATDLPGADVRYLSLTPAQYSSSALVVVGFLLWILLKHRHRLQEVK